MKDKKKAMFFILGVLTLLLPFHKHLEASWSAPFFASPNPGLLNPSVTAVALDSNSNALIGWLDGTGIGPGGGDVVLTSVLPFGAAQWNPPEVLFTDTSLTSFPTFPGVFFDEQDNQMAFWADLDLITFNSTVYLSIRPSTTTGWPSPTSTLITGLTFGGGAFSADTADHFLAVLGATSTGTPPFTITPIALSLPGSWVHLPTSIDNTVDQSVAVSSSVVNGLGVAVWRTSAPLKLNATRYNFAANLLFNLPDLPLPGGATDVISVEAKQDVHGNIVAIYAPQIGADYSLYTTTLPVGSLTWSTPQIIASSINTATLAVDSSGNAYILWTEIISPTQIVERVAYLPFGGSPTDFTDLTNPATPNTSREGSSFGYITIDAFGNAAAIWEITTAGLPTTQEIQVSSKPLGQNWSPAITLSTDGTVPRMALNNQGTAVAAWIDALTGNVTTSVDIDLFPIASSAAFTAKVVKNRFLTQTSFFADLQWTASLAPNVLFYQIRQNGVLIATIPANGPLNYLAPLQTIQTTFTLTAIASNGNQSIPLSVSVAVK